ncbi:eCIS core domain-containing protein [Anabaena azotica]|uniref:DUF4157 domain-containing protein n=1 Tax=Anabaena azotica FACHB-119 TaxID=947527 RepID=A0ABR8DFW5_9NOST|nr:DUF4157 domain-containing protein [Anabaena azotica]MBD2505295.1 DUF4157 domain-containing protein [Anabaena azotica FACHB-119]
MPPQKTQKQASPTFSNSQISQTSSQFASRPFGIQTQSISTQQQKEDAAFAEQKMEATGLELQAKFGTITPQGQERLTLLQAKMDGLLQTRLENAATYGHNINRIAFSRPNASPPIQAKLTIGQPGDKYEQQADETATQVVQRIHQPPNQPVQRETVTEEEELQTKPVDNIQHQSSEEEELQMKPIVQRVADGGMAASPDVEAGIQRARGGGQPLADSIREPMEQAFGADFSGVRVHTDSQADQLNQSIQAKAFTTGQDVFFRQGAYQPGSRGGQELLAHELTHVVQQKGETVERSHQPQVKVAKTASQAQNLSTIQRKFVDIQSDPLPTPAEAIRKATNVPLKEQLLPGTTARRLGNYERPKSITALVDARSIREGEREKATELSVVTAMARAEQYLLQGVDLQKFYDAGHLIGDQLIAGTTNSFQYYNLAPQVSQFNTPVYSATENQIKETARSGSEVCVKVDLTYPSDYQLTIADLVKRPVISNKPKYDAIYLNTAITIPRRIPTKWHMTAWTTGTMAPTTRQHGTMSPTLGQPFGVEIQDAVVPVTQVQQVGGPSMRVNFNERQLIGVQWSPSSSVSKEDIISLLVKTFPDVGEPKQIAEKLLSENQEIIDKELARLLRVAAGEIALELLDVAGEITKMKDPSVLAPLSTDLIKKELDMAREKETKLVDAIAHLVTAKSWAEDLKITIQEARSLEPYLFTLSTVERLNEQQTAWRDQWDISFNQSAPDYQASTQMEEDKLTERFSYNTARDISDRVRNITEADDHDGGQFEMTPMFGEEEIPVKSREAVQITKNPPRYVIVTDLEQQVNMTGMMNNWIVKFSNN